MLSGQRHHVHTGVALVLPAAAAGGDAAAARQQAGAMPQAFRMLCISKRSVCLLAAAVACAAHG
jgi:hypothetical protein